MLPISLIACIGIVWAHVVDEVLFRGDAVYYYNILKDGSWLNSYRFEPVMFGLLAVAHPASFGAYIFCFTVISLGVLLWGLYRFGYTAWEQCLMILFFSCSFYGLHFLLNFQRQFLAIGLFVLALSKRGRAPLARLASLGAHVFAVVLPAYWFVRRLPATIAALTAAIAVPILFFVADRISPDRVLSYGDITGDDPYRYAVKQMINVAFVLCVLATIDRKSSLRALCVSYIVLCLPVVFWSQYAGAFSRVDYFFFPMLVAVWPGAVAGKNRLLPSLAILSYTAITCLLWIHLNIAWIIFGTGS